MQTLKFLGRGSAFNTKEGNTSAYFIKDNIFFLLDCGETVFHTLTANNKFKNIIEQNNIKDVQIYITHLHSDHVGSLSSLIYYCYYVLGITPKIHHPHKESGAYTYFILNQLLRMQGHDDEYEFEKYPHRIIFEQPLEHVDGLNSYGYTICLHEGANNIFYSGDCKELPESVLLNINKGFYKEVYLECSINPSAVHMSIEYLDEVICRDISVREKIYLMHIDSQELISIAKQFGFKVVELNG